MTDKPEAINALAQSSGVDPNAVIKGAAAMVRLGQERRNVRGPMPTRGEEARACIEAYLAYVGTSPLTEGNVAQGATQAGRVGSDIPAAWRWHEPGEVRWRLDFVPPSSPDIVKEPLYAPSIPEGMRQTVENYSAWLIETDEGASINYFQMVDDDDWTFDHNKAMHFARKQDAEKMIAYYGWTSARAVEHMMWSSSLPSTDRG